MTTERTVLGLGAMVFLVIGVLFLVAPEYWAAIAMGLALAGFASGRLVGFFVEGTAHRLMIIFGVLEAAGATVAFYLQARLAHIAR